MTDTHLPNTAIRILHTLKNDGPQAASQMVAKLGCSNSNLHFAAKKLLDAKLVTKKMMLIPNVGGKLLKTIVYTIKPDAELPPLPENASVDTSSLPHDHPENVIRALKAIVVTVAKLVEDHEKLKKRITDLVK